MFSIVDRLRQTVKIDALLRRLYRRLFHPEIHPDYLLKEIRAISVRKSSWGGTRLNLVVYSVDSADRFGGIQTSLDFAQALGRFIPHLRILVTENRPQPEDVAALGDFLHVPAAEDSSAVRQVVFIGGGGRFSGRSA